MKNIQVKSSCVPHFWEVYERLARERGWQSAVLTHDRKTTNTSSDPIYKVMAESLPVLDAEKIDYTIADNAL